MKIIDLIGDTEMVMAKIQDVAKQGAVTRKHAIDLVVLEGETGKFQEGENRPYVIGVSSGGTFGGGLPGGGGRGQAVSRSMAYRSVGTMVEITKPEIINKEVDMHLKVEDSQMRAPGGGPDIGADDKGASVSATEFTTMTLDVRLRIPLGQIIVAESSQLSSKGGHSQKIVLVSVK